MTPAARRADGATVRVAGGYALASGLSVADRAELYSAVLDLAGLDGLEVSVGLPSWPDEREAFERAAVGRERPVAVVVTLVGLAATLAANGIGIASPDPDRRAAALRALQDARDEVRDLAHRGHAVVGVAMHSYPSVDPSRAADAAEALRRSLVELADWDWGGAPLVVEHCDARSVSSAGSKGLLPLPKELEAVRAAAAESGAEIGVSINTGRSAIEGRGARTVIEHVLAAERAGSLHGVIISGAAAAQSAYGAAWADAHPPLEDQLPESALSRDDVRSVFEAIAHPLRFDGVKVATASTGAGLVERLGLIRSVLAALPARGRSPR